MQILILKMWIYDKKEELKNQVKGYMKLDSFPEIKGYNFSKKFDFKKFTESYINMGFQGSNLGHAFNILKDVMKKRDSGLKLFMAFTGNMISSGNREIIRFLVKEKKVDYIVTTAAGIEEDILKCIGKFHLGSFDVKGKFLLDETIGRIGNLFVPAHLYLHLEEFLNDLFTAVYKKQEKGVMSAFEITKEVGLLIKEHRLTKENHEESYLYWAAKNGIKVFCPAITDGAIGDISTFFKEKHPDFAIDTVKDNHELVKELLNAKETASLILGGGTAKHFLLNSAIFRDGFEHSIYITTATGFDGSDSGGNQEEAISWAKIKPDAKRVRINADATIVFPLLVAGTFN